MILDQDLVSHGIPSHLSKMRSMYEELFSGGKGYRGALVSSVAEELLLKENGTHVLSQSIEYIHNSSLLHDDVVDDAPLRRGKTSAWKKYGSGYAILAGDYLLAKVIHNLCTCDSLELIQYTSETILKLVEGEWLQDECRDRTNVTLEEMDKVHRLKTSALFSWCFKAPALLANPKLSQRTIDDLFRIGDLFGLLLQRSDDLLDYNVRNTEGKAYFKDIPAGYFNSFTIFLLEGLSEDQRLKAFSCRSLGDFKSTFAGDFNFDSKLEAFDEVNKKLLETLSVMIEELPVFSEEFKKDLLEASKKIYWRG